MIDENQIRKELTVVISRVPTFIEKDNSTHLTAFSYIRECIRVYRKCVSINFLDDNSIESLSIDYFSYINCLYATDKVLFNACIKYLYIILDNLTNILEKNELYESLKNLKSVIEIVDSQNEVKKIRKNKK